MSLADVVGTLAGSHQEVYEQIKARTVSQTGKIMGADLQGLMIGAGLMPLIRDVAADTTEQDVVFRGICIGLLDRFGPDGEVDFSREDTQALLDIFLADATVAGIIAQTPFATAAAFRSTVIAAASTTVPEFPDVTLRQIIEIREPALAQTTETNSKPVLSVIDPLVLYVQDAPPETISGYAEISYGSQWARVPVTGLENIAAPGAYIFFLTGVPFPMIGPANELRVVLPYNLNAYL